MKRARSSRSSPVQSGRRFIEQHDRGFERERACEANEFLQSERQVADHRVPVSFELNNVDDSLERLRDA